MSIQLDIPHKPQQGTTVRNDCGLAVLGMLIDQNVDAVLVATRHAPDMPMTFHDIYSALSGFGLPFYYEGTLTIQRIEAVLIEHWPVIALIGYGPLPGKNKIISFNGSHFVLIVGFDSDWIYYHDPMGIDGGGGYSKISRADLAAALAEPGWGHLPNQGIVVKRSYGVRRMPGQTRLLKPPSTDQIAEARNAMMILEQENRQLRKDLKEARLKRDQAMSVAKKLVKALGGFEKAQERLRQLTR